MTRFWRCAAAAGAILAFTSSNAQSGAADATAPDAYAQIAAVNAYMVDGSAVIAAQVCSETMPDFMLRFMPVFNAWRDKNSSQIALGATLSVQFKSANGEPIDPAALARAAAERMRTITPVEREKVCGNMLKKFGH